MSKTNKVIEKNVDPIKIAKYYLEVEIENLLNLEEDIGESLNSMEDEKIWALLEAISFTYGLNGVFYFLSNKKYKWSKEIIEAKDIKLTGMDKASNKIMYSDKVNQDPYKFTEEIKKDKKLVKKFKKRGNFQHNTILTKENEGSLEMLDSSHRFLANLLEGKNEFTAYVGRINKDESDKIRVGKSIFILMKILYDKSKQKEQKAILQTVKKLIDTSSDGKDAFKKYWIEYPTKQPDQQIKNLLDRYNGKS